MCIGGYRIELDALQKVIVEFPIFLIPRMTDHDDIELTCFGEKVAIVGERLWAALMAFMDRCGACDLYIGLPFICQPSLEVSSAVPGRTSFAAGSLEGVFLGWHSPRKYAHSSHSLPFGKTQAPLWLPSAAVRISNRYPCSVHYTDAGLGRFVSGGSVEMGAVGG